MDYASKVKDEPTITQDNRSMEEVSFQKLLEAAYVLQQQSGVQAVKEPAPGHTQILAEIVETQSVIQAQHLNLDAAIKMIAGKVQKITSADGVAVGVVEGDQLHYRAAGGSTENLEGTRIPLDSSLSALSLYHGQVLQTPQSEKDPRFNPVICRQRNAKSVVAVPVYHDGKIAAVLELVSGVANAFEEHDVRSCQLMAGLVTEAIARNSEFEWKQELAVERASMLDALEKLKPQLERLYEPETPVAPSTLPAPEPVPTSTPAPVACGSCGHELEASEVFCGVCGTSRDSGDIQNKWATLWNMRVASEQQEHLGEGSAEEFPSMDDIRAELEKALPDLAAAAREEKQDEPEIDDSADALANFEFPVEPSTHPESNLATHAKTEMTIQPQTPSAPDAPQVWTSAARTREWLDSMKAEQSGAKWVSTQWRTHRANIYLAAAFLLLLAVWFRPQSKPHIVSKSVSPATAQNAAPAAPAPDPKQNLTIFQKLLIGVGLAEAPTPAIYNGNPDTQVWVDVHTALYYCPGTDLYGKTPGGKFTTQRDAQQDQFEPALRKACN